MFTILSVITTSPAWLNTSINEVTTPRSDLDFDGVAFRTVTRTDSRSPGRTGLTQRNSSMPGEARLRDVSQIMLDIKPHHQSPSVPATSNETAEQRLLCRLWVDVKKLRIEALSEGNDLVRLDRNTAEGMNVAFDIVLEVTIVDGVRKSHCALGKNFRTVSSTTFRKFPNAYMLCGGLGRTLTFYPSVRLTRELIGVLRRTSYGRRNTLAWISTARN